MFRSISRRFLSQVPNIKLRPAQGSRSNNCKTGLSRVAWLEDDDQEEVEMTTGNRPFDGIVLCVTGDLDKVCVG